MDVNHLCPYDPTKAKALLAEAGYGPPHPLTFEIITDTEKAVFNVIATAIKAQMARLGVSANIKLVDKVTLMNTTLQDAFWDMYLEDLLSLLTLDSNAYLSGPPRPGIRRGIPIPKSITTTSSTPRKWTQ